MGKREIRPIATPKSLNRSSQKVAHVITSWMSTDTQNLVAIPPGVSFTRMREIAHHNVYSASFLGPYNELQQYVKRRGSAQGCAFTGLEDKNITFTPRNSRKPPFWGPILTGFFDRKPL